MHRAEEENPKAGFGPCAFTELEEPEGWMSADYSTADWKSARVFSEDDVRPKDGYDQIPWDDAAQLVWSDDLKKDNIVLFRIVIENPPKLTEK